MLKNVLISVLAALAPALDAEPANNRWVGSEALRSGRTATGQVSSRTDKDHYHIDVSSKTGASTLVVNIHNRGTSTIYLRTWDHRTGSKIIGRSAPHTIKPGQRVRVSKLYVLDSRDKVGVVIDGTGQSNYRFDIRVR